LVDLVVYQKVLRTDLDEGFLSGLASGRYRGVAVTSLAALDALLVALSERGLVLPSLTWGVIGPATARSFASRGLPDPVVPHRTSINDLISLLRET
jgi:uroporphyrinogen-III synthase